ncbi:dephospho-CoA kinase [Chelativorans sp. ZYF759]|uniref:dephospho-CoA kinase n=1 Tax=Chelativorans sp. ZYF759 TaxID=2692213 RepID=UPI00145F84E1|nr:dephospho-CoA kinase [Chelativorans sp. ZYF759]NMG37975.1 dephospho-CoA kinase [Chelativorans sp. ZYF759]
MIILGLTGSIGMGKSTTAAMFSEEGVPVHDSDEAVHRIYAGPAAPLIEAAFPGTLVDGAVDRPLLAQKVLGHPEKLRRLEAIIHPLVREDADAFLDAARKRGEQIVLLDIPLLFETGGTDRVDRIVVVTAPADVQRERVLARPGMTAEKFEAILARQVPDAQKRARADFLVDTSLGIEAARKRVREILAELRGGSAH